MYTASASPTRVKSHTGTGSAPAHFVACTVPKNPLASTAVSKRAILLPGTEVVTAYNSSSVNSTHTVN